MILSKSEIIKEMDAGRIIVEPFLEENLGPASIDLRVSNEFRIFKKVHEIFHVTDDVDYSTITTVRKVNDYFLLMPGETVHSITMEKITLADNICGWLEGRSTFARIGLMVHITASFMQPGISNKQVLEINNVAPIPLAIYPNTKICQFIFERLDGKATYSGKFCKQQSP